MLCILTHAFEDDWHQKVTKLSEHLKMHGSSICLGRLKELETPHQQLGARICTGDHQINNFDDERMELVGDRKVKVLSATHR